MTEAFRAGPTRLLVTRRAWNPFAGLRAYRGVIVVLLLSVPLLVLSRVGSLLFLVRAPARIASVTSVPVPAPAEAAPAAEMLEGLEVADRTGWDEALLHYTQGDLEGAVDVATREGLADLRSALEAIQTRYYAGREARTAGKVRDAIAHLSTALSLDKELGAAESPFSTRLRRDLSRLHVQQGKRFLKQRSNTLARRELEEAVELDRSNRSASQLLRRLDGGNRGKLQGISKRRSGLRTRPAR